MGSGIQGAEVEAGQQTAHKMVLKPGLSKVGLERRMLGLCPGEQVPPMAGARQGPGKGLLQARRRSLLIPLLICGYSVCTQLLKSGAVPPTTVAHLPQNA